jgi:hypothetical protein
MKDFGVKLLFKALGLEGSKITKIELAIDHLRGMDVNDSTKCY